jgi:hypothetical protein
VSLMRCEVPALHQVEQQGVSPRYYRTRRILHRLRKRSKRAFDESSGEGVSKGAYVETLLVHCSLFIAYSSAIYLLSWFLAVPRQQTDQL